MQEITILAVQMVQGESKEDNLKKAEHFLDQGLEQIQSTGKSCDFAVLPEMFCCPYVAKRFPEYAEKEGGKAWRFLSDYAKSRNIWLIGGSVPEWDDEGRLYNTSYVFNRNGEMVTKHRKKHLFDINIPGKMVFRESDSLTAGETETTFETEYGTAGVGICFDLRFPEQFRAMSRKGAKLIFVPAAFNMTTGPLHWELLFRARAVDTQSYLIGCSGARNEEASYVAYGNSLIADPMGQICAKTDETESILTGTIDLDLVEETRKSIPIGNERS